MFRRTLIRSRRDLICIYRRWKPSHDIRPVPPDPIVYNFLTFIVLLALNIRIVSWNRKRAEIFQRCKSDAA